MFKTGHLFAGGGGGLYADLIIGHSPIFAVEWDPYACAILRSRAADGWFPGLRVHEGDVRLFDPSEYAGAVDCIHAGFPCQDISTAGRGDGINGERSGLYREVLRCADTIRPRYLFLENVSAIVGRGLGQVLGDLADRGYDARWTCLSAAEVGAPHKRDRWWCLAEMAVPPSKRQGEGRERGNLDDTLPGGKGIDAALGLGGEDVCHTDQTGRPQQRGTISDDAEHPSTERRDWWSVEPDVGRLVNGMALRSHQISALGNGQVPLCAAAAWKILGGPTVNHSLQEARP